MANHPQNSERVVVDSYPTEAEAWEVALRFARILKMRGLADEMGVTVKKAGRHAWWIVLVKRDKASA